MWTKKRRCQKQAGREAREEQQGVRRVTRPPLACLRSRVGERSGGKGDEENGVSSSLGGGSENHFSPRPKFFNITNKDDAV